MSILARAPVRISFAGGGTDLPAYYVPHGGLVLSAAIGRYCHVMARATEDRSIRISSGDYHVWQTWPAGVIPPVEEPLSLPKAAVERFAPQLRERGVDLFLSAEVPPGSGLGSSSAMAVALVHALAAHTGEPLDAPRAAALACDLEIGRLKMPIGKQDQYASAFGGLNSIVFARRGVKVEPVPLVPEVSSALGARLLLFSTGQTHHSGAILRQQRADTTAKPVVTASLHRLKAMAEEMRQALEAAELDRFGALLHRGWQLKKHLSGMISSDAIDRSYAAARKAGALGGKITGAGGGGFLLLYCPPERQAALRGRMAELELTELPFDFDSLGARVMPVSDGEEGWPAAKVVPERTLARRRWQRAHPTPEEGAHHA